MSRAYKSAIPRTTKAFVAPLAVALALFCAGAATAEGNTHHYCSPCQISAGATAADNSTFYITQNYVHRVTGPGSGVLIAAGARYMDSGALSNWVYSTSSEAIHSYDGSRPARGLAQNLGSVTYSFNAHVTY